MSINKRALLNLGKNKSAKTLIGMKPWLNPKMEVEVELG
jgi:hypothetical protein